jgi:hypothetical protein
MSWVVNRIEAIALKKEIVIDKDNKKSEIELDDENIKLYIGKYLIELAAYTIFMGTSLRLSNLISEKSTLLKIHNENDAQTFFSVILNGLIIPVEVLDKANDKGGEANSEELDHIIDPEVSMILGKESTKIFYLGLKGGSDESSHLLEGRKDVIKESIIFTENIFKLVNDFIDELTPPAAD